MEMFAPKPGGLVDRARKAAEALEADIENGPAATVAPIGDLTAPAYDAVRVQEAAPDLGTARTVTLSASNPYLLLLPRDPQRRSAVILAVDSTVYLSQSQGLASDVAGTGSAASQVFVLPTGVAITVDHTDQVWAAAASTSTSSRVSVIISRDSGR